MKADLQDGDGSRTDLTLLTEFSDVILAGYAPVTRDKHQGTLLRFARWLEPRGLLDAVSGDITTWLEAAAERTRSDRVHSLHAFYNWALNEGLVSRDPAAPLTRQHRRPLVAGDFPEQIRAWWISQERRNLARSTIDARARELRLFHDWLAPKAVVDASEIDIETWLDTRRLTPRARYTSISHLHVFYRWAKRAEIADDDPTERIDRPRLPQLVPRPISETVLEDAIDQATPQVRAMLCLAAFAGLRAKEIAGMRREDILDHLDPPILIVTAPKGNRQRTVPISPRLWAALEPMLPRSGYLFCAANGAAWPAWKVSMEVGNHLHAIGSSATCHSARHYFGTHVYANSLDLRLTQELLGHSSPTTTACYVQFNRSKAADVVSTLGVHPPPKEQRP